MCAYKMVMFQCSCGGDFSPGGLKGFAAGTPELQPRLTSVPTVTLRGNWFLNTRAALTFPLTFPPVICKNHH